MGLFTSTSLNQTPDTSAQQTVTPYAQPYVSNLLDKSASMLNAPTPAYTGQLTAGYSPLQQQAFQGLSSLTLPSSLTNAGANLNDISQKQQALSYNPDTITANEFDATQAQKYMNPYIQASLDPQLAALQRQQQINQQGDLAKLTQAGAYGGSRQAILQGQNNENLLREQNKLIGSGYNQAYQNATQQFNADAARDLQAQQLNQAAKQFGSTYGLQSLQAATQSQTAAANAGAQGAQYGLENLKALNTAGGQQQALDQQALNAQYNEYLRQLKYPQDMLTSNASIIKGLPISTTNTYSAQKSLASLLSSGAAGAAGIIKDLTASGYPPKDIADYIKKMFTGNSALTDAQIQAEINKNPALASGEALGGSALLDAQGLGAAPGTTTNENGDLVYVNSGQLVNPPAEVETLNPNDYSGFY
jgi:hypothetical protein